MYIKKLFVNYFLKFIYFYFFQEYKTLENKSLSLNILTNIISKNQFFIPAYFSIWKLIKKENNKKLLFAFSYFLIKISHSDEVNLNQWITAYILYSKALCFDGKLENALEILRSLIDIFPCFPLEDLKYIEEINKNNKISFKNNLLKLFAN